ncbi:PLP-dependent aminotransferase family protein [Glycomyces paridis]|uniref:PLP-dependent aminotransferase family protein n=1 Tax=Glycomyces paridis TaxID=2126555 RepID=A0A4S8PDP8_9ACTN|nr:PLP-dependent aminotransferase family protein [Glycomyces paridis]THV27685.1 PLP-dependent aminotransferase family protein [Glycomyces paridis]
MVNDSSERIAAALRERVAAAAPGALLPSTRAIAAEFGAGPVTVQRALRLLNAQGLVESRPGVGTFVRARRTARPGDYGWQTAALGAPGARIPGGPAALRTAGPDAIALHSGYPDRELLPETLVKAALARAARGDAAIGRPPATGLPELRAWFAAELGEAAPAGTAPPAASDVVIVPGSQSGLSSAFRVLVGPGRPLLIESPTYWGAITAAAREGVATVPIPSGPDGPDPDQLAEAFARTGARAFYAQPNFANPTGAQWTPGLAGRVLDVVRDHGAFLIEDDWAREFGIDADAPPLAARDDAGHVVYLRSLTKSVSPAVRVAAVIARGPARERIIADARAEAMYVSGLLQAAALDVVTRPAWRTHRKGLRHRLASRRDLLAAGLRELAPQAHLTAMPRGGLHLWARLPDGTDLPALVRACDDAGVLVVSGDEWFPAEPTGPHLRLNYSGPDPGSFREAAAAIGRALG